MKVAFRKYCKYSSVWHKTEEVVFEASAEAVDMFVHSAGMKKVSDSEFWKQTAYNEAEEVALIG